MPVCVVPGYDPVDPLEASETLHRLLRNSVFKPADWPTSEYSKQLGDVFADFGTKQAEA